MDINTSTYGLAGPYNYPSAWHLPPSNILNHDPLKQEERSSGEDGPVQTSSKQRPKRTSRARFSKVRTGCVTCKRRHVKCDETKPCCRNCMKWAGFCGGYENTTSRSAPSARSTAASSPRTSSKAMAATGTMRLPVWHTSSPSDSEDQDGEGSTPSTVVASEYDGISRRYMLDDAFWKEVMPRLVRESDAVRSASVAVHRLILAKGPLPPRLGMRSGTDHYGRALSCYGHALRAARQASAKQEDPREAILCSMFFVVFETVNGDQAAAAAHLQSGQRILDELTSGPEVGPGPDTARQNLRDQLRHVVRLLALQARNFERSGGESTLDTCKQVLPGQDFL